VWTSEANVCGLLEESDKFRFLHISSLVNPKGSTGLILSKSSPMMVSFMLTRSFIPLSRFPRVHPYRD
jgi:hypothetical protein